MATEKVVSEIEILFRAQNAAEAISATERFTKAQESVATTMNKVARATDEVYRLTQDVAKQEKILAQARAQGLSSTSAYVANLEKLDSLHRKLTQAMNDNAKGAGLAKHEMVNLGRQASDIVVSLAGGQSPFMVMLQQGTQVADILGNSKGGVGAAMKSLGENLLGLVTPGRVAAAGIIGGLVAVEAAASRATSALANLGAASRESGLSPTSVVGAGIIGAGAGLDSKGTQNALENARQQFESYKRASGDVHDALEKIDKGFLSVADRAKTAGDFIEVVQQKIRSLPREEALDLSQKLFGADAGQKLFENIRNGELSMRSLADATGQAGKLHDELATKAEAMQREIDKAAEIASTKLLIAFQELGNPIESLKLGWYGVVGAMADAVAHSRTMQGIMQGFLHPIDTMMGVPGAIGSMMAGEPQFRGRLVPVEDQFETAKSAFFRAGPQVGPMESAGASRVRYQAREDAAKKGRSGKTAAEREEEKYDNIIKDIEQQVRLVRSVGEEHKRVQWEVEKENWLQRLGNDATAEHKKRVGEVAEELYKAREAQDKLNEKVKEFNEAYGSVSQTVSGALKDIIHGGKPGDVLKNSADSIYDSIFDAAMTGSGPFAKMLGLDNKTGGVGGLFGSLASMFGLGGKDVQTQTMKVNAANVVVNGGAGAAGGLASLFSSFFGSGPTPVVGGAGSLAVPTFADGGIMTSRGPLPLHRYAGGGVASSPQLALFGEGRGPEAFVPLPDGRSIPVTMHGGGKKEAAPVIVNLIGAPAGTQVSEQTDSRGGRRIDVVFDERSAAALSSPQGAQAMRSAYGVQPKIARR
jgi:hypothetical protein